MAYSIVDGNKFKYVSPQPMQESGGEVINYNFKLLDDSWPNLAKKDEATVFTSSVTANSLTSNGTVSASGNISTDGTVVAGGDIASNGNLTTSGDITATGNLSVDGTANIVGDLSTSGNVEYENTFWEDLRFPVLGETLASPAGRVDLNFYNGTLGFQNNARYPEEAISIVCQLPHAHKSGTALHPHIHWLQQSSDEPNWLLLYKATANGGEGAIETDYTNHTTGIKSANAHSYTGGVLHQITEFPVIDTSGLTLSSNIHFVLFRDTSNTSDAFTGTDPSSVTEHLIEFDIHYQIDQPGSQQEYVK